MDSDVECIWACSACTFHNADTAELCAMCGTVAGAAGRRPAIASSAGAPAAAAADASDEGDRELLLALSAMAHCGHCLGVAGTNCSCGLQCAKGPAAKCVGDPVADAVRRRDRERAAAVERERTALVLTPQQDMIIELTVARPPRPTLPPAHRQHVPLQAPRRQQLATNFFKEFMLI